MMLVTCLSLLVGGLIATLLFNFQSPLHEFAFYIIGGLVGMLYDRLRGEEN